MTTGYSGSFAINGVRFILQPEVSRWINKDLFGVDGTAHGVYPAVREYEAKWGLAHPNDVKQFVDAFTASGITGSLAFDLPEYGADDFKFKTYSGCVIREVEQGEYFNGYITSVRLLITKITT